MLHKIKITCIAPRHSKGIVRGGVMGPCWWGSFKSGKKCLDGKWVDVLYKHAYSDVVASPIATSHSATLFCPYGCTEHKPYMYIYH